MNAKILIAALLLSLAALAPRGADAQTNYTENFTGTTTTNTWTFLNGACLMASTSPTSTTAPGCVGSSYYSGKGDATMIGGYNNNGTADPNNGGALRFTNNYNESGAILSGFSYPLSTQGLSVSFTTVTYDGDSGGAGGLGADGISFFLQDASFPADVGAFGGSLGYTCSNSNNDGTIRGSTGYARGFDGLQGGYVGLGIDEYGNFLNGVVDTQGTGFGASGDNTATGGGYKPGRIGLRGPGSVTYADLARQYPLYYPSFALTNASQRASAVQQVCRTGLISDWSTGSQVNLVTPTPVAIMPPNASSYASAAVTPIYGDYAAVPNGYKVLPLTQPIANEGAGARANAVPITYNLKITPVGALSLSYSYNGGANQAVIANADITAGGANPLPSSIRFGFAGSTGGARNVHEIMCFQATPSNTSASSAGLNQKQTAKVQTGSQVYFAYYNPLSLAGSLTSQYLVADMVTNVLSISTTINWDGSCVLTGVPLGQNCDTTGPAGTGAPVTGPAARNIFSWNYNSVTPTTMGTPIAFEWTNLTTAAQNLLDSGDATVTSTRLDYLRGIRTQEQVATSATTFSGLYRARTSVLGDIVDSSPTWVGPPGAAYPNTFSDLINSTGDPYPENGSTATTYSTYASNPATACAQCRGGRTNVVYAGANDGMLHGFRSGSYNTNGTINQTNNDGYEVMAYIPGQVVQTIQNATNVALNFSDPQYGHRFHVDAPPGTGDLFYNNTWHTWLVGGLGPGGRAIYALDVTDPTNFSESSPGSVVVGEWNSASITCNVTCNTSLQNTFGVPIIRRMHNGNWAVIFGNGLPVINTLGVLASSGDAGIFIMLVDSSTGATSFRYLSTGAGGSTAATANGIAYVAAADLDGDRITDYVYAGDIKGNVWRFDVTSTSPSSWAVTPNPIAVMSGQPITSAPVIVAVPGQGTYPHVMVEFGTGRQVPQSLLSSATYQPAQMAIYGVWDWNMSSWNSKSTTKFATPFSAVTQPSAPAAYVNSTTRLVQQTITGTATATVVNTGSDYRAVSTNAVCYADVSGCTNYGWYLNLATGYPNASDPAVLATSAAVPSATQVYEQVIFSPVLSLGALVVNTTIPPQSQAVSCYSTPASGWTMALDPGTGGSFATSFFEDNTANHTVLNMGVGGVNTAVTGLALGGTGSFSTVLYQSQYYGVSQTTTSPFIGAINPPGNLKGKRVTWIQKR
jgi:type IV pilus assembly protein PilY1